MQPKGLIAGVTLALSLAAWPGFSQQASVRGQEPSSSSSSAVALYAMARFTDGSGNNHGDFAQPIGQAPGSNVPADGYILDPTNNLVNLKFTVDNGDSSLGYTSGNVKIVWSAIPAGYASPSAFMNSVKVSGTKGSAKINNGRYVWTSNNAVKPGQSATIVFQFPLRAADGSRITTTGAPELVQLFSQKWGFTVSVLNQPTSVTNTSVYLSGTVNLERAIVTFQSSGCITPNPNPVTGPISLGPLVFATYANPKNVSDAFLALDWSQENPQSPQCPTAYTLGIVNAKYTFSAYYQCRACSCPTCGVVCTDQPPVTCWSAPAVYKHQQCRFQTYSDSLPTTFTFSGPSSTGNSIADTYCCPSLP